MAIKYENALLSAYFFSSHCDWHFKELDPQYFSSTFKKELVRQINTTLKQDHSLEVLELKISQMVARQIQYQDEWVSIIGAMPLWSEKSLDEVYKEIKKEYRKKILRVL